MALFVPPVVRATDANNLALSGAQWFFYTAGTTTPAAVYTTSSLSVAHANPVVADSGGLFAPIYLDPEVVYRAILKTSSGATIQDVDPYNPLETAVATRAAMAAFTGASTKVAHLTEAGREGLFFWSSSNLSAYVTLDTQQGIYVAPASDTTGASGAWVRKFDGPLNVRWFGAKGDLSQDDQPAIQCAVNVAAGRTVYAPVGRYKLASGIVATDPMHIVGDGNGAGPGTASQSNNNVTQFHYFASTGYVIQVTSVYPSIFENFQINVAVANRPMTSGGGIYLIGTGTGTVANYKIRNVAFNYVYTSILITRPAWGEISGCYFGDWVQDAIKLWTDQNIEGSGGHVFANYFFGQTSSATQRSCIYLGSGYVNIYDNEMLGALTGIYIAAQNSPVGFIRIWQNTIEEQHDNGIYISSVSNTAVSMVEICNNEFSCVPNGSTYVSSVNIDQNGNPAVNFITDLHVCQNITRHTFLAAGGKHYYISNCKNALISGNILEELGANSPTGIQLTGASSTVGLIAPIVVRDNLFVGTFTAKYALPTNNVVTVHDSTGSTVATLPTNAANGSSFWATDGTPGTYGNAIAGAGTGASVKRVGGAWVNG